MRTWSDECGAICRIRFPSCCSAGLPSIGAGKAKQSKGIGGDLLSDAVLRVLGAARSVGVRAILVHAISERAKAFYEVHGFRPSPLDSMTLMITIDEAAKMLR